MEKLYDNNGMRNGKAEWTCPAVRFLYMKRSSII